MHQPVNGTVLAERVCVLKVEGLPMKRSALMVVGLLLVCVTQTRGGNIVYNIVDHPELEGGYHISGTITTDGTLGIINTSNILSWQFTMYNGQYSYSLSSNDAGSAVLYAEVDATTSSLFIPYPYDPNLISGGYPTPALVLLSNNRPNGLTPIYEIGYGVEGSPNGYVPVEVYGGQTDTRTLWSLAIPYSSVTQSFLIASNVPEPSSIASAGSAVFLLSLAAAWRRRQTKHAA
jgi:hypothetical protein